MFQDLKRELGVTSADNPKLASEPRKEKIMIVEIGEDKLKDIIRRISWENDRCRRFSYDELLYGIIKLIKCDLSHAKGIIEKMKQLGLSICVLNSPFGWQYDLWKFGYMRGYLSDEEMSQIDEELEKKEELLKQFIEKHGDDDSKWSEEIWDQYRKIDLGVTEMLDFR